MHTQTGKFPKTFRTDRGLEYLSEALQSFLIENGIKPECTVGYAAEQNGVAERKNRSLVEAARIMLTSANLPKNYWGEAVNTANFVLNRIAAGKGETRMSPFEKLFKKKPNLLDMHEFGTEAYVMIPAEKRRKLSEKAEKMIFVGYDDMAKGYRFANVNNKIRVSREVKFLENCSTKQTDKSTPEILTEEMTNEENHEENFFEFYWGNDTENVEQEEEFHDAEDTDGDNVSVQEEESDESDDDGEGLRRSTRINFGNPPERLGDYHMYQVKENVFNDPKSYKEAISSPEKDHWNVAMQEELDAIEENATWKLTELPKGRKAIGSKWVFKTKRDENGTIVRHKARLVAQGFSQRFGVDHYEVFAPVVRSTTLRLLLSVAGTRIYHVRLYDIKSAFLNGKLNEEIFLKPPPGHNKENLVYKLEKSLYGLKQSARVWNKTLNDTLEAFGCKKNQTDNCLYSWHDRGKTCYILVHVDDLLVAGNCLETMEKLMEFINKRFKITDLGGVKLYLGIEVTKDKFGRFVISQRNYIDSIIRTAGLEEAKISKFPMDPGYNKQMGDPLENNRLYRKLIGMLLYLSTNTRPEIAASVAMLSKRVENPRTNDLVEVKRVVRYLKGTKSLRLKLNDIGFESGITAFSDADWTENNSDRKSNTGFMIPINGGTISWCSRKQDIVALSSAESEYVALAETTKEIIWVRELMKAFDMKVEGSTTILTDSQSCIAMLKNQKFSNKTKHIDTRYHFIKDMVLKGTIELAFVGTDNNTADLMTKPLSGVKTTYHRERIGLVEHELSDSRRSVGTCNG